MDAMEREEAEHTPLPRMAPRGPVADAMETTLLRVPGLQALVHVTREGEVLHAAGEEVDVVRAYASLLVGLMDLADRLGTETGRGAAEMNLVACSHGHLSVHRTAGQGLLLALASPESPLGIVVHDIARLAETFRGEVYHA